MVGTKEPSSRSIFRHSLYKGRAGGGCGGGGIMPIPKIKTLYDDARSRANSNGESYLQCSNDIAFTRKRILTEWNPGGRTYEFRRTGMRFDSRGVKFTCDMLNIESNTISIDVTEKGAREARKKCDCKIKRLSDSEPKRLKKVTTRW
jgi:hypothetical protein